MAQPPITRYRRLFQSGAFGAILLTSLYVQIAQAALLTLVVNQGLSVDRGMTKIITRNQLQSSKGHTATDELFYYIDRTPGSGTLKRNGVTLSTGAKFTQYDIDQGRVTYTHNGSLGTADSFDFSIHVTERLSVSSSGEQANKSAECISVEDDGRFAVFYSKASNLVSNDTNNWEDVFIRDRAMNTTAIVSVSSNGVQGDRKSLCSSISRDGRYVVFQSDARNLVPGDTNSVTDIFVRDRQENTTKRISLSSTGAQTTVRSYGPAISKDGRYVSFSSLDSSLVSGDTNNEIDTFVHDLELGTTIRATVANDGSQANDEAVGSISDSGTAVVFHSAASNLVSNDTNVNCDADADGVRENCTDIFVRDLVANTTTRVSVSSTGAQTTNASGGEAISGDGRIVAFLSFSPILANNDTNGKQDVFVHDRQTGQTTRVSVSSSGVQATDNSGVPVLSEDGRYVAFPSKAPNLVSNDTNGLNDVFVHDRNTGITRLASTTFNGQISDAGGGAPFISSNGRVVGFQSTSTNLLDDAVSQCDLDNNGSLESACPHLYIHDAGVAETFNITVSSGTPAIAPVTDQTITENTSTGPTPLFITDQDTAPQNLTVTATSSDQILVPNANITISGSGANKTIDVRPVRTNVRLKPLTNPAGSSATITVTVSDGTISTSTSFMVTVKPPTWLVMLYVAADDSDPVVGDPFISLNDAAEDLIAELNTMPYNPDIRLVVLHDGNQTNDSSVYVRDPSGLVDVTNQLRGLDSAWPNFPPTDELNTGSSATLQTFVVWARRTYADSPRTFLALLDHGGGWSPDINELPSQHRTIKRFQSGGWRGMNLDLASGTSLSTSDTGRIFFGQETLDVMFFDACLMGMIESTYEVRDAADYLIAGENLLFADYPYSDYLAPGALGATTTPRELTERIVDRYNATIDATRHPFTVAGIDLRRLRESEPNNVVMHVNTLADELLKALPASPVPLNNPTRAALTQIYAATQKFDYDSSQTIDATEGYVDLADLAKRLRDTQDPAIPVAVRQAAGNVFTAITGPNNPVVIRQRKVNGTYNGQSWTFDGAYGLSIFLPLGEQDFRPSRVDSDGSPAQPEAQLNYYIDPNQLAFTRGAPKWAELLQRLKDNTPMRTGTQAVSSSQMGILEARPFYTPFPIKVAQPPSANSVQPRQAGFMIRPHRRGV